jgi:hypothetical protein
VSNRRRAHVPYHPSRTFSGPKLGRSRQWYHEMAKNALPAGRWTGVLCTIFHCLFSFREANNEWMTVVSGGFDRPENSGNGKKSWKSCSSTTRDEGMTAGYRCFGWIRVVECGCGGRPWTLPPLGQQRRRVVHRGGVISRNTQDRDIN